MRSRDLRSTLNFTKRHLIKHEHILKLVNNLLLKLPVAPISDWSSFGPFVEEFSEIYYLTYKAFKEDDSNHVIKGCLENILAELELLNFQIVDEYCKRNGSKTLTKEAIKSALLNKGEEYHQLNLPTAAEADASDISVTAASKALPLADAEPTEKESTATVDVPAVSVPKPASPKKSGFKIHKGALIGFIIAGVLVAAAVAQVLVSVLCPPTLPIVVAMAAFGTKIATAFAASAVAGLSATTLAGIGAAVVAGIGTVAAIAIASFSAFMQRRFSKLTSMILTKSVGVIDTSSVSFAPVIEPDMAKQLASHVEAFSHVSASSAAVVTTSPVSKGVVVPDHITISDLAGSRMGIDLTRAGTASFLSASAIALRSEGSPAVVAASGSSHAQLAIGMGAKSGQQAAKRVAMTADTSAASTSRVRVLTPDEMEIRRREKELLMTKAQLVKSEKRLAGVLATESHDGADKQPELGPVASAPRSLTADSPYTSYLSGSDSEFHDCSSDDELGSPGPSARKQ